MTIRSSLKVGVLVAALLAFSPAQALAQYFGAIAYQPNSGAYGYSYDYSTRAGAQQRALRECGRGCRIVVWFRNACGALAVGSDGWGSGWASSRARAETNALSGCTRHSYGCRIQVWACTTR